MSNAIMRKIELDFVYSSTKDFNALMPLYNFCKKEKSVQARIMKIHKSRLQNKIKNKKISKYVILSHSHAYYRLKNSKWDGEFFYVDHGIRPINLTLTKLTHQRIRNGP